MLLNKSGFRIFNEYDLDATLQRQLLRIKKEVDEDIQLSQLKAGEEEKYIAEGVLKYKIQPLDFDKENLTLTTREELIPAEYFPSGFFVRRGQKYSKEVFVFHLPFRGDRDLLHSVPSPRIMWTEEVDIRGNELIFEIINFNNNAELIMRERDQIIKFLIDQASYVNKQVNEYNENLTKTIQEIITQTMGKLSQRSELLAKLGTPLKIQPEERVDSEIVEEIKISRVVDKKTKEFDVFICHANEDKDFVNLLAEAIKKAGIEVWYDNFELGWGDDLRSSIDNGLKNSKFGIVVFSKSFLAKKKWTEYELNGLLAMEKQKKVVLPVWHKINKKDLEKYSPTFADRLAKQSNSIEDIVGELKKLLKK